MYFVVPLFLFIRTGSFPAAGIGPYLVDLVVILLTASRLFGSLFPFSGHMLFLN